MPRIPDNIVFDLDQAWSGVDERTDGGAMPSSSEVQRGAAVAEALNVRFTGRSIETRPGYLRNLQFDRVEADWGPDKVVGSGSYVDPVDEREWLAVAWEYNDNPVNKERKVWFFRDESGPRMVPAGILTEFFEANREQDLVRLSQLGGDFVMWRRAGREPLLWDGDWTGEFLPLSAWEPHPDTPDYYRALPAVEFAAVAADRLVFPYKGGIGWTDILEARRWHPDADAAGSPTTLLVGDDGGAVTGLLWWRGSTLLVFKESSVWSVENFYGDLSAMSVNPVAVSRQVGCVAPDSIVEIGGDVLWLSRAGVQSLSKVLDTDKKVNEEPVSWPIPKTMARINGRAAHLSHAVVSRDLLVLAVPLDGAEFPNTLLVMSAVTFQWQGTDVPGGDYGPGEYFGLARCRLFGRQTYAAVRKTDLLVAGWSWKDRGAPVVSDGDIATRVRFRGHHAAEHSKTRWVRCEVATEELGTENVTLTAYGDGHHMAIPLQGPTTRDRTRWLAYGRVPRDMANNNDDADAPGREDYACQLDAGVELHSGITLGLLQAHTLAGNVPGWARTMSPTVTASAGRLRIHVVRGAGDS